MGDLFILIDMSGLDRRLADVRLTLFKGWWSAAVKVGGVTIVVEAESAEEAVAALVSSGLLWDELGERQVREG